METTASLGMRVSPWYNCPTSDLILPTRSHRTASMEIRALTESDVAVFWPLRLEALRTVPEAFGSDYEDARARPLSYAAERLRAATPDDFTLGAFEQGALIGMVGFRREQGRKE